MATKMCFTDEATTYTGFQTNTGGESVTGGLTTDTLSATSKFGLYGTAPVAQRGSTTSTQRTSLLSTATGTISVSTAAFNQMVVSLQEVMNTLAAYGLWSIS